MNKIQTLKGFRDFLPRQAQKRQYVINILKEVFELYGFAPLETPVLEYEEILTGKYGEEGDKLMYRFVDNGGRNVAMRYDQTVPLSRVVAQYKDVNTPDGKPILPFPFKRYQIQNVYRADNTQKGRFREFLQCDIDTVGTDSPNADAEIIAVVNSAFEKLGFSDYTIQINDRVIFGDLPQKAITIVDKLEKQGEEQVKKELTDSGFDPSLLEKLKSTPIPESLTQIIEKAQTLGVFEKRLSYTPTLARGLDYYTGMILEVSINDYAAGSVGGGGRYDKLIGMFLKNDIPAVGFSFGFDRIIDAMEEKNLFPDLNQVPQVLVTLFSSELSDTSTSVAAKLRTSNINTELWLDENIKMEKQLKYADQKNIPYVVIIGPDEAQNNTVTVKNLKTKEQKTVSLSDILTLFP